MECSCRLWCSFVFWAPNITLLGRPLAAAQTCKMVRKRPKSIGAVAWMQELTVKLVNLVKRHR